MRQTASQSSKPSLPAPHRAEIDGLRAIAVLAVVLYHFGIPGLRGGFVGVDIFFVISGFLIGGILWREKTATGRLSLGRFYMRRIRRLAPAYVAMSVAVLVVGWMVLLPFDYRETAKGVIAATVYLSNVQFFRQSGYFDGAAEDKVLLHTWSLSVEEQFYLFLPLVFLLFSRSRRAMIVALVALFIASLLSAIPMTSRSQTAAFYLFPFRAWELLAGVLLAIWGQERASDWRVGPWASWLGLVLILGGIVWIQPGNAFPGWQAMVPVLGTVLLLVNGQDDNPVNRVLSMRGPVWIGLISYSLYLWHWPVFTLSTYVRGAYGVLETGVWVGLSFALAWVSWRFVEQPVRRARDLSGTVLLGGATLASLVLLGASAFVFKADGVDGRFGPAAEVHIAASSDFLQDFSRCYVPAEGPFEGIEVCPIGPEGRAPRVLIWGDSHVRAFYEGLAQAANEHQRAGLVIWRAGCAPVFDLEKVENSATDVQNRACRAANDQIRSALAGMPELRDVLLIGRWAYYTTGTGTGNDVHNTISLSSTAGLDFPQDQLFAEAMGATVNELALLDRSIYGLRQPPEIAAYKAPEIARALAHRRVRPEEARELGRVTLSDARRRAKSGDAALELGGAQVIETWDWFCDDFLCDAVQDGVGYYFDNNHVTNAAARNMRRIFDAIFEQARP
ncbi:acyltransferase family protein [Shimia abyssi]|uniref:Peptidoglycan/LPS O-acetylase OafA/YrhL n=1 Tax=Shimia abyssi TaxID=1662395 RepID=A0A2P8FBT4_9RHOB|nr:acyltransferase family protein [Shimia abyssi]PSL19173.1 peptidoglycan/LPS O-acetylase OafA/YrhL [Shimia abyssi]